MTRKRLEALDAIMLAGLRMSNRLYNWSQRDRFTPEERRSMREDVDLWDRARSNWSALSRPQSPKSRRKK